MNMKESELLGTLMPSHPDLQPIIQEIRKKYQLPEVDPDGEPITSQIRRLLRGAVSATRNDMNKKTPLPKSGSFCFLHMSL
jgi:hypothetical protein